MIAPGPLAALMAGEAALLGLAATLVAREFPGALHAAEWRSPDRGASVSGDEAAPAWTRWIALGALVAVAAALRASYLSQPMRYDEAWTYLYFASHPLRDVLSDYPSPNNHVFHTLLVWAAHHVFGGDAPWMVRFPAFTAGVLLVPATYWLGRRFHGPGGALLAAALVAVSPPLVLFSTNARGYSIVTLLFVPLVLLADTLRRDPGRHAAWVAFALLAALGLYTVPAMLYPLGAVLLWLAWCSARRGAPVPLRGLLRPLVAALVLTGLLTVAAFGPVILRMGIRALLVNQGTEPETMGQFLHNVPGFLAAVAGGWTAGFPWPITALLAAGLVLGLIGTRPEPGRAPLLGAAALWTLALSFLLHNKPQPRFWLFLIPLVALVTGAGLALLADRAARLAHAGPKAAVVALALLLAAGLSANEVLVAHAVYYADDTGALRDAPAMGRLLARAMTAGDYLVVKSPSGPPLAWVMVHAGVPLADVYGREQGATRLFVVVNRHLGQTLGSVLRRRADLALADYSPPRLVRSFPESDLYVMCRAGQSCPAP